MATQERSPSRESSGSFFREVGDKKQNLRRIASEVGNMAAELSNVRTRAAAREAEFQQEVSRRQVAEANTRDMTQQLEEIKKALEDSRLEAQTSASVAEQSLKELMDVTERLAEAEEILEGTTASATSLRLRCETLMAELEQKDAELQQHRTRVEILEQQLAGLMDDVKPTDIGLKQLRYEVDDLEAQIEMTMGRAYANKEFEFRKLLNEFSTRNIEQLEKQLLAKDDEIARLRHDVKVAHAETKSKSCELDSQVEKQKKTEHELQMKIIKLEFCFQESQKQTRKLKKSSEKKEQENQNLRAQLWLQEASPSPVAKSNFWDNFKLPGILSMSAVALVCMVKR